MVTSYDLCACLFYHSFLLLATNSGLEDVHVNDVKALSGGLGGEIAYLVQSASNFASGFVVSFIQNWKITLVMMAAGPVMATVEVCVHKVSGDTIAHMP